jgi:hypothetical protein
MRTFKPSFPWGSVTTPKFFILSLIICSLSLLINFKSFSQTGDCATSNCVSADIKVSGVKLVQKINGQYVDLPKTCNAASDQFNVSLQVSFNVTSQTRYGFLITSLIYFDGVAGKSIEQCTTQDLPQGPHVIYVDNYVDGTPIVWHCGQRMELKATYTAWNNAVTSKSNPSICSYYDPATKTVSANACKAIAPKCKYYGPNESFLVLAPLSTTLSVSSVCGTNNEAYKTYTFTGSASGGFLNSGGTYTYKWYIDNVVQSSTTTNLTYTPTSGSNFTVKFEAYDQTSPTPTSTSSSTTITPAPCCQNSSAPSSVTADQDNKCPGTAIKLTVNGGTLGTNASWKWYTGSCGGTLVGTGSEITVSPTTTTTYYVRAEGDCGTTTCANITVHVKTNSTAPTSVSVSGDNYCANSGSSATLTVVGGNLGTNASWKWYTGSCGGTLVGTGSEITVSPTTTTTYYVRAEGDCGTTTCASGIVNVKPVLDKPGATVTQQPTCSTLGTVTVSSPDNTITYTLSDNNNTYTAVNGVFSSVAPGTYTFTASKTGSCSTPGDNVVVNDAPTAPDAPEVIITTYPDCSSSSGMLSVRNGVTHAAYGSGYEFSNDNGAHWVLTNSFSFIAGQGYNISVRRVSPNTDCVASTSCQGEANNGSTLKANTYNVTAELNPTKTTITAAPNPFNDRIRFSLKSSLSGQGRLELYNMQGQKVKTVFEGNVIAGQVQNIEYSVPGSQRASLIYVFTVGKERMSGKLINLK